MRPNYAPPDDAETARLNRLFEQLWSNRTGVVGSFAASSYRSHPTFIRRGALLLRGEYRFCSLFALCPANAVVQPKACNPAAHFDNFPTIADGRAIGIARNEPGLWWQALRDELPKMEQEIADSIARGKAEIERARQEQQMARAAELADASDALRGW